MAGSEKWRLRKAGWLRRVACGLDFSRKPSSPGGRWPHLETQPAKDVPSQAPGIAIADVVHPAFDAGVKLAEADSPGTVVVEALAEMAGGRAHLARLDQAVTRMDDETQPRNAAGCRQDLRRVLVNRQPQVRQTPDERTLPRPQLAFAVAEQRKVVDVAQVRRATQLAGDELVERMQVTIRPELRGQIADRQATRAAGRQEIVARKIDHRILVVEYAGAAFKNVVDERQHVVLGDRRRQRPAQDRVVDRREVLDNVCAQHVVVALCKLLQPVHSPVCTLANAVGVAVGDEQAPEARLDDAAQRVMDHAVGERGGADLAPLRFGDGEVDVRPWPVTATSQIALDRQQVIGELVFEGRRGALSALAACGLAAGRKQVLPRTKAVVRFAGACAGRLGAAPLTTGEIDARRHDRVHPLL